ncbi:MAG: hypothetical protein NTW21_38970 [Verrucomicrobia bacterium]|nr:hypothetical protein [Verrucomicrobiota bacterium]
MSLPVILQEELDLKRCKEDDLKLAKELAEALEVPLRIAREKQDRENTLPPLDMVNEITWRKRQELPTRSAARNHLKIQGRSLLLLLTLGAAAAALILWGLHLMKG